MSSPAVMIATVRIRAGDEDALAAWKGRLDATAAAFPGFISSDVMPPGRRDDAWTILLNFDSKENVAAWLQSGERAEIVAQLAPLAIGGGLGEIMQTESADAAQPGTAVTQVIFSQIKFGMEDGYREWAARMQQAQSRYPGYRGMYLQPPAPGGTHWITMLRFDTTQQMNAWMAAPERAAMLKEARAFVEDEELLRLATSFPGWVRIDPETGEAPPNWKTALLVLLGLNPIVALSLVYLNPLLGGLPPAIALFVGNVTGVAATSFVAMPLLVRRFDWWLFENKEPGDRATAKGLAILAALLALEIVLITWLFRWHSGS